MTETQDKGGAKRRCLVTGASSGIGKAIAEVFAEQGWDLVLTARREERLIELAKALESRHGTHSIVITMDLAEPNAPQQLYDILKEDGVQIDGLVNNAGYGVPGYYIYTDWEVQRKFIQVLATSVAHMCHLFLPHMIKRGYGRILNVSSVNGIIPVSPGQTLYAAAKAFVNRLSHTLHAEASDKGVNVCALCPGFTKSEFHDVTGTRDMVNQFPDFMWMDAKPVAQLGFDAVMRGDVICVPGAANKITTLMAKWMPLKSTIRSMAKRAKNFRKEKPD